MAWVLFQWVKFLIKQRENNDLYNSKNKPFTFESERMTEYNVNYLLSISRLPDHFYSRLKGLSGKDAEYKNPGVSLRSFVIARCVRRDRTGVPADMVDIIKECEHFSNSGYTISQIVEWLITATTQILARVDTLPAVQIAKLQGHTKTINELVSAMKMSFDAFILSQDPSKDYVDIDSKQGIVLRSILFDLDVVIEDLAEEILG